MIRLVDRLHHPVIIIIIIIELVNLLLRILFLWKLYPISLVFVENALLLSFWFGNIVSKSLRSIDRKFGVELNVIGLFSVYFLHQLLCWGLDEHGAWFELWQCHELNWIIVIIDVWGYCTHEYAYSSSNSCSIFFLFYIFLLFIIILALWSGSIVTDT